MVGWREKWRRIRPFFLIFLLHAIALVLFTRGFLLTRTELSAFSQCSDISQSPCVRPTSTSALPPNITNVSEDRGGRGGDPAPRGQRCWTKPAVGRLLIIVLDALRFDFVAPSAFFDEVKPWMDKLQVLQKLALDECSSAKIFKAIADPPTTSLQRLKGLTTGGLPTFIDVGNSFGAPAIIEDNLILQLAKNGKRVLMMGDDTWIQLFPDHFAKSYPFPSFNVKDLDTVDNGCIENLLPAMYEEDWDVLIAHFLGVDHAGHIFGVDSGPMLEKLEQYNTILEKVVEILKVHSGPGGLHENTLFIVMGDHGQTLNGDHGGGTAEEVETSLFAMSMRSPPTSVSPEFDTSTCKLDLDGKKICFSSIQQAMSPVQSQLDFAATMAALLDIPFPFGSIGQVNPELYALSAGTWNGHNTNSESLHDSNLEAWLQNYADVLCINCWQVKRYIDLYSTSSVIGFPKEDLAYVAQMYAQAQSDWSISKTNISSSGNEVTREGRDSLQSILLGQIDAFSNFLERVAELARSKWTEFDLEMMAVGLCVLLLALLIQVVAIKRVTKELQALCPYIENPHTAFRRMVSIFIMAIRACSFLSNSYILAEGKVAKFLLASTGILNLRDSVREEKMVAEALVFLLLNFIIGLTSEFGLSKQAVGSAIDDIFPLKILQIDGQSIGMVLLEILPMLGLMLLGIILYRSVSVCCCWKVLKYFFVGGTFLSYILIAVHWALESNMLTIPAVLERLGRNFVPQMVYAVGFGLLLLASMQMDDQKEKTSHFAGRTFIATVAMLSAWNSTVLILLGRQGPFAAMMSIIGGWCIIKLQTVAVKDSSNGTDKVFVVDSLSVTQWSLLAVCLFFYTGHWCTFDGLRYGAAFIGFDDFNLTCQGFLLAIDTFGISHIFPIIGLPLLAVSQYAYPTRGQGEEIIVANLTQAFLIYGLVASMTTTFTIICVTIQRRHLMVWGLFAPKYVFDVVGLMLTDLLICLASLYYF